MLQRVKKFIKGAPVLMLITTSGMVLGVLTDVALAYKYGIGNFTDSFTVALLLPLLLDTILREGVKFSLVPFFLKKKESLNKKDYNNLISAYINFSFLLGLSLALILFFTSHAIVGLLGPGLDSETHDTSVLMFRILTFSVVLIPPINLISVVLNSHKNYRIIALRNLAVYLPAFLFIILFINSSHYTIIPSLGYLLGFLTYFSLLFFFLTQSDFGYNFKAMPKRLELQQISEGLSYPTIGFAIRQISRLVEKSIATLLFPGGITIYNFCYKIFSSLQTIIGVSVSIVSITDLTERIKSKSAFMKYLNKKQLIVLGISSAAGLILFFFSEFIFSNLFRFNKRIEESDTDQMVYIFYFFLPGLIFYCLRPVVDTAFYALNLNKTIFYSMVAASIVNVSLSYWLSLVFGLAGIALSVSLTAFIFYFWSYFYILRKKF